MIGVPAAPPRNPFTYRTPRQFRDLLSRHRRKAVWFFGGTMVVVTLALFLLPRTYVSEAKLFVRLGRESVTLDPTATTGQMVPVHESREGEISSVLDVLRSRVLLERVVDDLGIATVLSKPKATEADRNRAIRVMLESVVVSNGKKSSVITVTGKADSPEKAQRIVRSFVDAFHVLHIQVNRTDGSHAFFLEQSQLMSKKLAEARGELAATKSRYGIITIEGQRKNLQDQISTCEAKSLAAESDLASAEATIARIERMLEELPERILLQQVDGFPNSPTDAARQQIFSLEVRERELLTRYTKQHPLVISVREQIEEARRRIVAQDADRKQSTSQVNPARQSLALQYLQEQSRAASLAALTTTLRAQQARLQGDLRDLNDREAEIEHLDRQVAMYQKEYLETAERLEQTRIGEALQKERISNVNMVQPATLQPKPVAPKRRILFVLGLFVATVGAAGLAFGSEYLAYLSATTEPDEPDQVTTARRELAAALGR